MTTTEPQPAAKKPTRQHRLSTLLIVFVCVIPCSLAGWWSYCSRTPPSDEDLRARFREHSAQFLRLRSMILEEPAVSSVGDDNVGDFWLDRGEWTTHEPPYRSLTQAEMLQAVGLAQGRYQEYLDLLDAVGAYRVTKRSNGEMTVCIFRSGLVSSGINKNVVYSPHPPPSMVTNTDSYVAGKHKATVYAELGEGWYIEHQRH